MSARDRRVVIEGLDVPDDGRVLLGADDARYVARVLRLGVGDAVELCDGRGNVHGARVLSVAAREVVLEVVARSEAPAPLARPRLHLILGLPKAAACELALQKCTELGVDVVTLALCERSVSRPKGERKADRWREIVRQAARQSERAYLPELRGPVSLGQALAACNCDHKLVASVAERGQWPGDGALGETASVALAVGPEGGFTPGEIAAARAAGFRCVGLGQTVLRAETAAMAMVAIAAFASGRLDM